MDPSQVVVKVEEETANNQTTQEEELQDGLDQDTALIAQKKFNDMTSEEKLLEIVRYSVQPFSDRLDPFAALPVTLNRFQEHLISFYLLYYPKATYGFSPRLRPHPVASNFSIALTTPACFQVIMARSALYRIGLNKYSTDAEKKSLELAVIRHKGEALRMVRALSLKASSRRRDDLLASIISLGTFDRRAGSSQSANYHYLAVRKILRTTGGPLAVDSVLLSRVMCFFECIYGTSPESYVWDASDLGRLVSSLNNFLRKLREVSQSLPKSTMESGVETSMLESDAEADHAAQKRRHFFGLQPNSTLLDLVMRRPPADNELSHQARLEMVFQLTCLLTLAMLIMDHVDDFLVLQAYMDNLHKTVEDLRLAGQSCNNAMWQIQVNDHSDTHSKRIWRVASFVWVLKHCSYSTQTLLKEWLLQFLRGESVGRAFRLDPFHFSYAS